MLVSAETLQNASDRRKTRLQSFSAKGLLGSRPKVIFLGEDYQPIVVYSSKVFWESLIRLVGFGQDWSKSL